MCWFGVGCFMRVINGCFNLCSDYCREITTRLKGMVRLLDRIDITIFYYYLKVYKTYDHESDNIENL